MCEGDGGDLPGGCGDAPCARLLVIVEGMVGVGVDDGSRDSDCRVRRAWHERASCRSGDCRRDISSSHHMSGRGSGRGSSSGRGSGSGRGRGRSRSQWFFAHNSI